MARVFRRNSKWWIDYNDVHTRRHRECVGANRAVAQQVLGERLKEITEARDLGIRHIEKITLEAFAEKYLKTHAKPNKLSWERDESVLRKHLLPLLGNRFLTEITPEDIEKYKVARTGHVKPATVNRELDIIKTLFAKALEWGYVRDNITRNIKKRKVDNTVSWFTLKSKRLRSC